MRTHDSATKERAGLLVLDACEVIAAELTAAGIEQASALRIARATIDHLCAHWGGWYFYWPRANPARMAERNAEIIASFDGKNLSDLSRRHNLTEARIRQILGRQRGIPHE